MLKPTWAYDLFLRYHQYKRKAEIKDKDDEKTYWTIFITCIIYIAFLVVTLSFAIPSYFEGL